MNKLDLKQAIEILRKAGLENNRCKRQGIEPDELVEYICQNLEKIKKARNPVRYIEEKISYLEELYGPNIWRNISSPDPLFMLDKYKAGILRAIKEEVIRHKN